VDFLALCQGNFHLYLSVFEIDPDGDYGKSFLLDLAQEPEDLPFVQEQFSLSEGVGWLQCGIPVWGYVEVIEPSLSVFYTHKAVFERDGLFVSEGFDFRAFEHYARLVAFNDLILCLCLSVEGYGKFSSLFQSINIIQVLNTSGEKFKEAGNLLGKSLGRERAYNNNPNSTKEVVT
jgi:hypothetical protein